MTLTTFKVKTLHLRGKVKLLDGNEAFNKLIKNSSYSFPYFVNNNKKKRLTFAKHLKKFINSVIFSFFFFFIIIFACLKEILSFTCSWHADDYLIDRKCCHYSHSKHAMPSAQPRNSFSIVIYINLKINFKRRKEKKQEKFHQSEWGSTEGGY